MSTAVSLAIGAIIVGVVTLGGSVVYALFKASQINNDNMNKVQPEHD